MQRINIGLIILHINNTTLLNKAKQAKHFYCAAGLLKKQLKE